MFHRRFNSGRLIPLLVFAIVVLQGCGGTTNAAFPPAIVIPTDSVMSTPTGTSVAKAVEPVDATPTATVVSNAPIAIPDEIANRNTTGDPVTLRSVTEPPLITQQQAMEIVAKLDPWGLGGNWHGYEVTVQAWYGLGTVGRSDAGGNWLGPVNIPLSPVQTLDNIKNRPIWLLAYSNVPGVIASGCPGCPEPPFYTHDVYAVDAQSESVIWFASYPQP